MNAFDSNHSMDAPEDAPRPDAPAPATDTPAPFQETQNQPSEEWTRQEAAPMLPRQEEATADRADEATGARPGGPEGQPPQSHQPRPNPAGRNTLDLSTMTEPEKADSREPLPPLQHELPLQQPQEVITIQLPDEPFAKRIQKFRLDANVPLKEVSDKTKISATFINDLEQGHYSALPSKDFCLAKIEQLCIEYDVDSKQLIEKFCVEYQEHKQKEEPRGHVPRLRGRGTAGTFIQTTPQRLPGLPAIFIGIVLLLLIGLLAYAFHAHQTHQMPDRLDADLTEHIPVHQPEIILLDEVRR